LRSAAGFQALAKVDACANGRHVLATFNVVDDDCIVGPNKTVCLKTHFSIWACRQAIALPSNMVGLAAVLAEALKSGV
jgi:hypothetical protein